MRIRLLWRTLPLSLLLLAPLTGCELHDKAFEPESKAKQATAGSTPAESAQPAEVTVSVGGDGAITCRSGESAIPPVGRDDLVRNASIPAGTHLLIVHDSRHDTEQCFPVDAEIDGKSVFTKGGVSLQRLNGNLIVDTDGPARITLSAPDSQDLIDECVEMAGDDEVDRLASRLDASPGLIDGRDSKTGETPLARAAQTGRTGLVEFLLNRKAGTEIRDNGGFTPLQQAVRRGRLGIVKALVEHGADKEARTPAGATPIQLALADGRTEIASFLAGRGAQAAAQPATDERSDPAGRDHVFQLTGRRIYGPFSDGSSIRAVADHIDVLGSGKGKDRERAEFDLPDSTDRWTALEGTHFKVTLRGARKPTIWASYRDSGRHTIAERHADESDEP